MVKFIKRDKNDIFNKPLLGFLFKNKTFLLVLRIAVAALFFYAVYFGFVHPGEDNIFTGAVFWGIFWALFMVVTLPTFGRIFCGICPHGFLGKYITKFGLNKEMPKWLQNRYIGIFILVIGWWAVYYTFPNFWKSPFNTALMFTGMTLISFVFYFLFKDMGYCKYICPIGTLTRSFDKLAFTKLETYQSACKECRSFECATACPYNLKPFSFEKKNQTDDCTLCMECAHSCEAVKFKFTAPGKRLYSKFKGLGAEIWTYILILAAIPISMTFAHGLDRSKIADHMIWNKTAAALGLSQYAGGFAFVYAVVLTAFFGVVGLWLASVVLKKDFKSTFTDLGYAYAPLFILGSLGHTLETFFTRGSKTIVEGFAQGFGFTAEAASLASRGDGWLVYLGLLKWLGIVWALIILSKRLKAIESTRLRKTLAYIFASFLIIFYVATNMYTGYVFSKYGAKSGGHGGHGGMGTEMFQTVPFDKATLLQKGKEKASCPVCGMKLPMFYKTNHAAKFHDHDKQYCSIHCLAEDLNINKSPLTDLKVVDTKTLKFIDAKTAFYVVGSKKSATMSRVSKYAFGKKADAETFVKRYGGKITSFDEALKVAMKDFQGGGKKMKKAMPGKDDFVYFTLSNPMAKSDMGGGMHSHGGGGKPGAVATKEAWLVYGKDMEKANCLMSSDGELFYYGIDKQKAEMKKKRGMCPSYKFTLPGNGYYDLYYTKKIEKGNELFINSAKLEYLRGAHGAEDEYVKEKMAPVISDNPIEIIRLRDEKEESFFYKHQNGDLLKFQMLINKEPATGGELIIHTKSGWSKKIKTDDKGYASFYIIKDYFPKEWSEFDKRRKGEIVVVGKADQVEEGKNVHYTITYPLNFYPNESEYKSYGYSLIFITLTILFGSIIIYRYRSNRTRPFQELKHEE